MQLAMPVPRVSWRWATKWVPGWAVWRRVKRARMVAGVARPVVSPRAMMLTPRLCETGGVFGDGGRVDWALAGAAEGDGDDAD